ncbi:potassium channel family protein [Loktanella sp. M215]|uniref:potassium channel family protein n=1 Tax=Loktanella sp. M215 TaxID=2675431 RepID=UPI001F302501|nr:potassium channel family protein [Loktanella sp. M215]MCF7700031.1 ion transporter [Loktanella sp. M215]
MRDTIRALYEGDSDAAVWFRYTLLAFDLLTLAYVIATSFIAHTDWLLWCDLAFGVVILLDFAVRAWLEPNWKQALTRLSTWADIVAVLSFLGPLLVNGLGFLRVLRTLRLLKSYETLHRLRSDFDYFRRNEDVFLAVINLGVFVFVMTGLIYASQVRVNDKVGNYADAFYFTMSTLTTTGFGDIVAVGLWGRLLSVFVMIFGVTLFLQLAQVLFRPYKVRFECPNCGLLKHDRDAVHCKHCGDVVHIEYDGAV